MIKYELKKLFTNKFVIAMFAVIFTVILAIAIYTYSEYKKGMRVEPILMKKWTVTETAVTKDNIFDFIARYDQIKNDDDNYDYVDTSKRGNSRYLQGSKTTEIEAKINLGYFLTISSGSKPKRVITPGRKFSTTTSALAIIFSAKA